MRFDLVILGDTPDAWSAAETAARLGRRTAVLRTDARAAGVAALLRAYAGGSTATSAEAAPADLWRDAQRVHEQAVARSGREFGIRSWLGPARLTGPDSAEVIVDDVPLGVEADRLLIATGTTSRRPRGLTVDRRAVLVPEEIGRVRSTPRRLLVLGGGRTARATARLFAAAGSVVTLVDAPSGASLEAAVASRFRIVAGEVLGLRRETDAVTVRLTDGRDLPADAVVFAADRPGATTDIGLEAAGLEPDEDGRLWCDDLGRTWVPSIAATGEVVGFPRPLREADAAPALVESLFQGSLRHRPRTAAAV